jgi:oligoribonuclease (3'-5' exoribonuclease)
MSQNLVIIEIETLGLKETDPVIELSARVMTKALVVLNDFHIVINPGPLEQYNINSAVLDMHYKNGLIEGVETSNCGRSEADYEFSKFLSEHLNGLKTIVPVGSVYSHFTSRFLKEQFPLSFPFLAFWNYDTGILRRTFELAGRPDILGKKHLKTHRATDNVNDTYQDLFGIINALKTIGN